MPSDARREAATRRVPSAARASCGCPRRNHRRSARSRGRSPSRGDPRCARRRTADAGKRWQQHGADRSPAPMSDFGTLRNSPAPVGRVGAGSAADIVASRVRVPRAPNAARSEVSRPAPTAATPVPWRVPTRRRSRADPRAERGVVAAGGVGIKGGDILHALNHASRGARGYQRDARAAPRAPLLARVHSHRRARVHLATEPAPASVAPLAPRRCGER